MVKLFIWLKDNLFAGLVVALAGDVEHARAAISALPQIENSVAWDTVLQTNPQVVDLGECSIAQPDQAWWWGEI